MWSRRTGGGRASRHRRSAVLRAGVQARPAADASKAPSMGRGAVEAARAAMAAPGGGGASRHARAQGAVATLHTRDGFNAPKRTQQEGEGRPGAALHPRQRQGQAGEGGDVGGRARLTRRAQRVGDQRPVQRGARGAGMGGGGAPVSPSVRAAARPARPAAAAGSAAAPPPAATRRRLQRRCQQVRSFSGVVLAPRGQGGRQGGVHPPRCRDQRGSGRGRGCGGGRARRKVREKRRRGRQQRAAAAVTVAHRLSQLAHPVHKGRCRRQRLQQGVEEAQVGARRVGQGGGRAGGEGRRRWRRRRLSVRLLLLHRLLLLCRSGRLQSDGEGGWPAGRGARTSAARRTTRRRRWRRCPAVGVSVVLCT